jgi:hypothetical protein
MFLYASRIPIFTECTKWEVRLIEGEDGVMRKMSKGHCIIQSYAGMKGLHMAFHDSGDRIVV